MTIEKWSPRLTGFIWVVLLLSTTTLASDCKMVAKIAAKEERNLPGAFKIVGFGDSITQAVIQLPDENRRWLNILKRLLGQAYPETNFSVVNAGIGGNSTREAMARFDKDVLAHQPDLILLEFGGNNNDPANPSRRVSPDEFRALLRTFKQKVPEGTRVIVITFPPVIEEWHGYWKNPALREYTLASEAERGIEAYRQITRAFAAENGYSLFDLNALLVELSREKGHERYTLPDGVHLTAEANRILAECLFPLVKKAL